MQITFLGDLLDSDKGTFDLEIYATMINNFDTPHAERSKVKFENGIIILYILLLSTQNIISIISREIHTCICIMHMMYIHKVNI